MAKRTILKVADDGTTHRWQLNSETNEYDIDLGVVEGNPVAVTAPVPDAPDAADANRDRLYEAVLHLLKGGTLDSPTINDLLRFIKPGEVTPQDQKDAERWALEEQEKERKDHASDLVQKKLAEKRTA